jgi:integrase
MRLGRKSSVQPSQVYRRKKKPKKVPGDCYRPRALHKAVVKACGKAGVPHWHANQLRHLFATEVRKVYGLEAAQVVLGHARADVTQVYAERDLSLAVRVSAELG